MEKKIRYLMLLLCLCLFPMKAFALEGQLEEANKDVVDISANNNINIENQNDVEDLKEIENPNTVLLDNNNSDETVGNEYVPTNDTTDQVTTDPVEETTKKVENVENQESEEKKVEEPAAEVVEISEFTLNDVNTDFVVGEAVTFGGQSAETDKYTIVREEWRMYADITKRVTSDATYNSTLPEGTLLEAAEDGFDYDYYIVLQIANGYRIAEDITVNINGTTYEAYYDEEDGIIDVNLQTQAKAKDVQYIDSLDIENVVMNAIEGQAPTYGAESVTDHISVEAEKWWYYYIDQNTGALVFIANSSDLSYIAPDETPFDTFDSNYEYFYAIYALAESGYRLNFEAGSNFSQKYKITINGETLECEVYSNVQEDGTVLYFIVVADDITPTKSTAEESSPVYEEPVATETAYYEEEEETATLLVATTTDEKKDATLEVNKDKKDKSTTESKKKKESTKEKSNVGLIIFLIILIAIAIAIPLTVYKKEQ